MTDIRVSTHHLQVMYTYTPEARVTQHFVEIVYKPSVPGRLIGKLEGFDEEGESFAGDLQVRIELQGVPLEPWEGEFIAFFPVPTDFQGTLEPWEGSFSGRLLEATAELGAVSVEVLFEAVSSAELGGLLVEVLVPHQATTDLQGTLADEADHPTLEGMLTGGSALEGILDEWDASFSGGLSSPVLLQGTLIWEDSQQLTGFLVTATQATLQGTFGWDDEEGTLFGRLLIADDRTRRAQMIIMN